jgi:hypothetical protein
VITVDDDRGAFAVPPVDRSSDETRRQAWDSLVFALIYPVLSEPEPVLHVERVMEAVIERRALGASPEDYRRAIAEARGSVQPLTAVLSGLLTLPHTDDTLWRFLDAIERRLTAPPPTQANAFRRS